MNSDTQAIITSSSKTNHQEVIEFWPRYSLKFKLCTIIMPIVLIIAILVDLVVMYNDYKAQYVYILLGLIGGLIGLSYLFLSQVIRKIEFSDKMVVDRILFPPLSVPLDSIKYCTYMVIAFKAKRFGVPIINMTNKEELIKHIENKMIGIDDDYPSRCKDTMKKNDEYAKAALISMGIAFVINILLGFYLSSNGILVRIDVTISFLIIYIIIYPIHLLYSRYKTILAKIKGKNEY